MVWRTWDVWFLCLWLVNDKFGGIHHCVRPCVSPTKLRCYVVQFMPRQCTQQQDEFHPPRLLPSECETMVSIWKERKFHDFSMSKALAETMKFPLLFQSVISEIAFALLVTESRKWNCTAHISFRIVKCYVVQPVFLLPGAFHGDILSLNFKATKHLLFAFGIGITFCRALLYLPHEPEFW